jgi:hypothetical protein
MQIIEWVDMLRKFVAHFGADFVVALAVKTVGGGKAAKIGYRLNVPYENVWHVMCLAYRGSI